MSDLTFEAVHVRELRKVLGLTQGRLSKWLGVDTQTIARWEKGHNISGPAKVVLWLLYDEQVNRNDNALRDYLRQSRAGRELLEARAS